MQGNNSIGAKNEEQLQILSTLKNEIEKYATDEESYNGYCIMLDAPGGTGKTFLINRLLEYVSGPHSIALATAFTGNLRFYLKKDRSNGLFCITENVFVWYLEFIKY